MKIARRSPEVPITHECDVLVAGGGPSGFAAAVTAARNGAKVIILERGASFGGMWTLGLVSPYFDAWNKEYGLNKEIMDILKGRNAWGGLWNIAFDNNQMVMALDEIAIGAGVTPLFLTYAEEAIVENGKVKGIIYAGKGGSGAILANVVIDCTGDGDIAASAGAKFEFGRPGDALTQPMTMMFKIGGVRDDYPKDDIIGWYREITKHNDEAAMLEKIPYDFPAIIKLPRSGEALIQWTHVKRHSGIDTNELSNAVVEGRKQVRYALELLKSAKDVLGDVYLLELPYLIGVRDTRRILGDKYISDDDVKAGTLFEDTVCNVRFGIDIHEPDKREQTVITHEGFNIPYGAMLPKELSSIIVAGRCISGSWTAHAAYRVTGNCVATGEAAGLSAAICSKKHLDPREIKGAELAATLQSK